MTDQIPVPDDVDRESYLTGYRDALGMVREACAMLEVGFNQQNGDDDGDVLVKNTRDDGGAATTDEADSDDECPDCGGALVPELGGRRCPACGYRDSDPVESDDEPTLDDLLDT
jgi:hypothetical protein